MHSHEGVVRPLELQATTYIYIQRPTDPEQTKQAAGVGAIDSEGFMMHAIPNPIKDYIDVETTGRLNIVCSLIP